METATAHRYHSVRCDMDDDDGKSSKKNRDDDGECFLERYQSWFKFRSAEIHHMLCSSPFFPFVSLFRICSTIFQGKRHLFRANMKFSSFSRCSPLSTATSLVCFRKFYREEERLEKVPLSCLKANTNKKRDSGITYVRSLKKRSTWLHTMASRDMTRRREISWLEKCMFTKCE